MLKEIPDKIDWHYKNTNITRVVGAGTAIAGGVLTVAGTVGSFFTFGLAAPVAGIGVALAVSGGGAAAGASIADIIVAKLNLSEVQHQLDIDRKKTDKLIETINRIDEISEVIVKRFPHVTRKAVLEILLGASNTTGRGIVVAGYGAGALVYGGGKAALKVGNAVGKVGEHVAEGGKVITRGGEFLVNAGKEITEGTGAAARMSRLIGLGGAGAKAVQGGEVAVEAGATALRVGNQALEIGGGVARAGATAARVGRVALQGVAIAGVALEVVLIPINIAEIVMSGMSLYRGSETKASHQLRKTAKELNTQKNEILKITNFTKKT